MTASRELRPSSKSRSRSTSRHSAARLAAVQALYQMEMTEAKAPIVIDEFLRHRLGADDAEAGGGGRVNEKLFSDIVRGVVVRGEEIDRKIAASLPENWQPERLQIVLRCILRAGALELMVRFEAPAAVVVSEYVRLAHSFFSEGEPALANGVLDRLARDLRPGELEARDGAAGDAIG
mgnify:CR=1 FL=1|jgi:transcription antitermination protein NusB